MSGECLEEHDAEAVEVRTSVDLLAHDLFGGEVLCRTQQGSGAGQVGVLSRFGDPEIGHPDPAVLAQHDVGRLDVAMDDAGAVGDGQGLGDLTGHVDHVTGGEPSVFVEDRSQRAAFDSLHHDRFESIGADRVIDRHDRRMLQTGGVDRLPSETAHGSRRPWRDGRGGS